MKQPYCCIHNFTRLSLSSLLALAALPVVADESARTVPAQDIIRQVVETIEEQQPMPYLTLTYGPFDLDQAYAIQAELDKVLARKLGPVVGYKVAYASKAAQAQFGVDEPARGTYFLAHVTPSGSIRKTTEFMEILLETEVAFTLAKEIVAPVASIEELRGYVRWVHPALDIGDFRFSRAEGKATAADMVASGTAAHGIVLGPGRQPDDVQVENLRLKLIRDGETVRESNSHEVMGNPWNSLLWCVNDVLRRGGQLPAGTVIATGTAAPAFVASGQAIAGSYVGDCGALGEVSLIIR